MGKPITTGCGHLPQKMQKICISLEMYPSFINAFWGLKNQCNLKLGKKGLHPSNSSFVIFPCLHFYNTYITTFPKIHGGPTHTQIQDIWLCKFIINLFYNSDNKTNQCIYFSVGREAHNGHCRIIDLSFGRIAIPNSDPMSKEYKS